MIPDRNDTTPRWLATVAVTLILAGCQRTPPGEPPAPPSAPGISSTPTLQVPVATDDVPPEGALRAYVWECGAAGKLVMRNLFRERAIELVLPEGRQRLDQTVSASGVRYATADASIVFWTKGSAASLERRGTPLVQCSERRAESLREDARLRGVVFRALGNEPGWTLEIGPGGTLDWVTNYGQERHRFDGAIERASGNAGSRSFTASTAQETVEVTVTEEPCTDDGDVPYDHTATIEFAGGTLRGCAVKLN